MTIAARSGVSRNEPMARGTRPTMPAKMMKLIPLPMPFSVMSSPRNISRIEPAVRVMIWVIVSQFDRLNVVVSTFCDASRARKPYDDSRAIGTARIRVYWLSLLRPYSPSRLSVWSEGMTPCISCMMIEALMYGFMPRPTTEKVDRPPPLNRSSRPKSAFPLKKFASAVWSTPGTGTCDRNRKRIRIPAT